MRCGTGRYASKPAVLEMISRYPDDDLLQYAKDSIRVDADVVAAVDSKGACVDADVLAAVQA